MCDELRKLTLRDGLSNVRHALDKAIEEVKGTDEIPEAGSVAPKPTGPKLRVRYERAPKTLGQHLKKRRVELGLVQRDVCKRFDIEKETYANWEKDRCYPALKNWPDIISFLGYDPTPDQQTLGQQLLAHRRHYGLSRKSLAAAIGVDEATLGAWEIDERKPVSEKQIDAVLRMIQIQAR